MNIQQSKKISLSNFIASSHARLSPAPSVFFLGGVCGSNKLNAASTSDAIPATTNVHFVADLRASPVNPDPNTAPSHSVKPSVFAA